MVVLNALRRADFVYQIAKLPSHGSVMRLASYPKHGRFRRQFRTQSIEARQPSNVRIL